jgi:hypothetical protein
LRIRRLWIVTLIASAVLVPSQARADSMRTVALWGMDEGAGAQTMYDASGNGLHGAIGAEVTALSADGVRGYGFERLEPDTPPTRPRHLVVVSDYADLDPGTRDFGVSLRLRTVDHFGNIIQKGQATVAGGNYKLQIPGGRVQCWFRGSAGALLVSAPRPINDGRWHTVQCWRTGDGVALAIDGTRVASRLGPTGSISNAWPISIGGKTDCDQIDVGCDYFAGDIDWIAVHAADHGW